MIMKILTTMRSKLIIISILYPLVKLMTLSLYLRCLSYSTPFLTKSFPLQHFLQKHVRDVHVALSLLWCGIAFKDVGYGDVKHRVVLCLLPPFVVAVNIWEGCHFTAFQDHQSVIELTFASCGQPDVFGEKERTSATAVSFMACAMAPPARSREKARSAWLISSSPLKSGLQVSVGHFFYLISQKISHF